MSAPGAVVPAPTHAELEAVAAQHGLAVEHLGGGIFGAMGRTISKVLLVTPGCAEEARWTLGIYTPAEWDACDEGAYVDLADDAELVAELATFGL